MDINFTPGDHIDPELFEEFMNQQFSGAASTADTAETNGHQRVLSPDLAAAIGQVFAGVTPESAARSNKISVDTLREALTLPAARAIDPTGEWDAVDLLAAEFRDTPDILAGVIPVGVTLLSAAPKVGKSRLLTQTAVAAVSGTAILGRVTTQTKVLTLSLEDGARRYRKALHSLIGDNWPGRGQLTIKTTSARLDEGGIVQIERHLDKHPDCRLVIIDVLQRYARAAGGTTPINSTIKRWRRCNAWRTHRQIAIVVVHHANQRTEVSDIFDKMSGTSGLTGVVDSLLLLERRRSDDVGVLHISGREVEDQEIALGFVGGWWGQAPEGMPAELLTEGQDVRALWLWLAENPGANTEELAKQYKRTKDATQKVLHRLEDRELIDSLGPPARGRPVCWQVVRP